LVPDIYRNEQIMLCTNTQIYLMAYVSLKQMSVHIYVWFIQTYIKYAEGQEMDIGPGRAVGMLHTPVILCALPQQKHSAF